MTLTALTMHKLFERGRERERVAELVHANVIVFSHLHFMFTFSHTIYLERGRGREREREIQNPKNAKLVVNVIDAIRTLGS